MTDRRLPTRGGTLTAFRALVVLLVVLSTSALLTAPAGAQTVELPEPLLLREGARAPFTGQLMPQEDLLRWAGEIEALRHQLALDVRTERERCDVRLDLERARTTAAAETLTLHETLWRTRVEELATALTQARTNAVREWWESPVLWFALGAVVTAGAAVALAVAVSN